MVESAANYSPVDKLLMVLIRNPDDAGPRAKMMFASSKLAFKGELGTSTFHVDITAKDYDDVDYDACA